jgi:hypothetical protein
MSSMPWRPEEFWESIESRTSDDMDEIYGLTGPGFLSCPIRCAEVPEGPVDRRTIETGEPMQENPRMRRIRGQTPTLDLESDRQVSDSNRATRIETFATIYRNYRISNAGAVSSWRSDPPLTRTTPGPKTIGAYLHVKRPRLHSRRADDLEAG